MIRVVCKWYDDVIIGAYAYLGGFAYVYYGSESGLSNAPDWTAASDQLGARFGRSVGTAGDVNGDGYDDVIIGASWYDNGHLDEGRAYVYYGSASGLSTTPDWITESDSFGAEYGVSVGTAGDVNADGYSDIVVGAHFYTNGQSHEGKTYVYYGSSAGLSTVPNWTFESNQSNLWSGRSLTSLIRPILGLL